MYLAVTASRIGRGRAVRTSLQPGGWPGSSVTHTSGNPTRLVTTRWRAHQSPTCPGCQIVTDQ